MIMNSTRTKKEIERITRHLYSLLVDKWTNTAISIFIYNNLPEGMTSKRIEKQLFNRGSVVFINDSELSYLTLPYTVSGGLNVYGEPIQWSATGVNGYNKLFNSENSVIIKNNELGTANRDFIEFYCGKLTNIEMAIDVNINANKSPLIFSGTDDELLTLKNIYRDITGNIPAIYKDKTLTTAQFTAHNTGVPYLVDKLMDAYNNYEGRILNYLGLDYLSVDKKERLIVDEVNANAQHKGSNFASMLDSRRDSVNKINEMFNLNIKVDINPELISKEEYSDGTIHD